MIGIDWGTTSFRAYRLDGQRVMDRLALPLGILAVPAGGFADALQGAIAPWLMAGERHVLMSGMVGSRQGWVEAPYLPCPAAAADLANAAVRIPFGGTEVLLVPGLSCADPAGVPEVMRGEEVQTVGALAGTLTAAGTFAQVCLPGSHSKWARIEDGQISQFSTHMTGEAFAALRDHTILGRLMQDHAASDNKAFEQGLRRSADPGGLLHHLFGTRTLGLFNALTEAAAPSYLSGLLIGHEVRAASPDGVTLVVGDPALSRRYVHAIELLGGRAVLAPADAAATGLAIIGERAPWTSPAF